MRPVSSYYPIQEYTQNNRNECSRSVSPKNIEGNILNKTVASQIQEHIKKSSSMTSGLNPENSKLILHTKDKKYITT